MTANCCITREEFSPPTFTCKVLEGTTPTVMHSVVCVLRFQLRLHKSEWNFSFHEIFTLGMQGTLR